MSISATRVLSSLVKAKLPLLAVGFSLVLGLSPALAEDEELRSLEVFNGASAEIVSSHRSLRPASQTAENITVLTSRDIEALNAHTLADILANTTGIQTEMIRTPGAPINLQIQGSGTNHVLVLIDDVPLNNLSDNFPDVAAIPVQFIERVEIVKGAASTTWGNALGGVVNVITKAPEPERRFSGTLSGSVGEKYTADTRGEFSGTLDRIGYYLTGGNLRSDGLVVNNSVDKSFGYLKLHYDLPARGGLTLSSFVTDGASGVLGFPPRNRKQDQHGHVLLSNLSLEYPFSDHLLFEATARLRHSDQYLEVRRLSDNLLFATTKDSEYSAGGTFKFSFLSDLQRVVAGVDYDHEKLKVGDPLVQVPSEQLDRTAERVGVYLNDTLTLGDFAITPSARYDRSGTGDDLFSPSFGVTYALSENSVLRGYTARGYSLTSLNRNNSTEKVWTSQVGAESGDLPYLWVKGTFFRNDTWNIADRGPDPSVKHRQLKQGYELEARTLPLFNTSLSAGYTFIHATDGDTGRVVNGVPRHTLDLGIKYQDRRELRALLTGRYLDWNDHSQGGRYGAMIWDLHLGKTFRWSQHGSLELFLSVWNLFNGSQYLSVGFVNPGRWGEVGVRCSF